MERGNSLFFDGLKNKRGSQCHCTAFPGRPPFRQAHPRRPDSAPDLPTSRWL